MKGAKSALGSYRDCGLIVFYFTQEPKVDKKEILHYALDDQVSFQGKNNEVSIGRIMVANVGNVAARNVKITFWR